MKSNSKNMVKVNKIAYLTQNISNSTKFIFEGLLSQWKIIIHTVHMDRFLFWSKFVQVKSVKFKKDITKFVCNSCVWCFSDAENNTKFVLLFRFIQFRFIILELINFCKSSPEILCPITSFTHSSPGQEPSVTTGTETFSFPRTAVSLSISPSVWFTILNPVSVFCINTEVLPSITSKLDWFSGSWSNVMVLIFCFGEPVWLSCKITDCVSTVSDCVSLTWVSASPRLCFFLWTHNLLVNEKAAPHSEHSNGVAPVCVFMCSLR